MKTLITSDYIETTVMDQFFKVAQNNWVKSAVLLPNASLWRHVPSGTVITTDEIIVPALLSNKVGSGFETVRFECDTDTLKVNRDVLKAMILNSGLAVLMSTFNAFIELGLLREGVCYITVKTDSSIYGDAIAKKYQRYNPINGKFFGFKKGATGYAEYLLDYNRVERIVLDRRKLIASKVLDMIKEIIPVDKVKIKHYYTNTLSFEDDQLVYRIQALRSNSGKVGFILGDMRTGSYISGCKENESTINSYPSCLGRTLSTPHAKEKVSNTVLKSDTGGTSTWMDDQTTNEAPFNFKSINTIREDSMGAVYSLRQIKPIFNVRM